MNVVCDELEQRAATLYPGSRRHVALADRSRLSDVDVATYHRDGFLAIDRFFTSAEVDVAQRALTELITGRVETYKGLEFEKGSNAENLPPDKREPFLRKLWSFVEHSPSLNQMAHHPKLLATVQRLFGSAPKLIQDMALLKPPRLGMEKPWHQDNAYFVFEPMDLVLGVWIALDRATPANGCMHVIPGSHLAGPKPHYHARDCQLPDETIDVAMDTVVPLEPGGILIFSSLLHHGTPPNMSPDRRRAVQFHYASVNCQRMTDERHRELFLDPAHPERYTACASHLTGIPGTKIEDR